MNGKRLLGVFLLVVGTVLLVVGFNASDSVADQVSQIFRGRFTDRTTWYIVGGLALAVVGLLMATFAARRPRAALLS